MLSVLVWLPIAGALVVGCLPESFRPRWITLGFTALVLLLSAVVAFQFNLADGGLQFQEHIPWLTSLGIAYSLGVDGLSLPLLLLNSFLVWIAVWMSDENPGKSRLYYALLLVMSGGVAGAFLAQNALLFFLFFELELIPLYLLITLWGGARRNYAATKFLIYTAISGILILAAFFGLANLAATPDFSFEALRNHSLPMGTQLVLLGIVLVAFGIKIPLVPFHTWLPDAHVEASAPISVLLAGVLLKLGTYGLVRFGLGFFPQAWHVLAPALATWAVVSVLYGCLTAIAQKNMKKMVAYSSIGHMGYVLLAAAAATPLSIQASVCQMVAHGLISGLMFLLVGIIYKKTGSLDLDELCGLMAPERGLPVTGSLMILAVMASAGIPSMVGFVGEFLVFKSSFAVFPIQTLLCILGTGLTAVYLLTLINRSFFGRLSPKLGNLPPVRWSERAPAIVVALAIVVLGLQPNWLTRWSEATAAAYGTQIASRLALVPPAPRTLTP
ncbi:NADH-quinone oxidoreductase subunit M [Gloeobacter kilaueensis]|uniref:NAD(P)H-quinone oxidoreductase subunit D4 n=1 Tax=Gloeobacter kilaueensis (strain ATCC BAA-2537 / CCAP 1431/1 / ULC 316 / JS1) TaxID=1183438 RepID=U5QNM8_GLOK1|nr:NADH-quinone oxidoreductase subunit M [Gloeobacter kilaueensis]AGY60592.1 NAD(P)H-quinone oxidoreductase subunit D4 [Gloeobacter kilaueensis JS1]